MQGRASFLFYGSLNDFLPERQRNTCIPYDFKENPALKDAIEALGVPHPEVALIQVNKAAVNFSYQLQPGDEIEVFPESANPVSLQPPLILPVRFVLDVHLGKLAKGLRLLGFDTLYRNDFPDQTIAAIAKEENRIVLTRDVGLLKMKTITWGYWLRSQNSQQQLMEVISRFNLLNQIAPFTRCLHCNGLIREVSKAQVLNQLLPNTRCYFHDFYQCQNCQKIYWKGSHFEKMEKFIKSLQQPLS